MPKHEKLQKLQLLASTSLLAATLAAVPVALEPSPDAPIIKAAFAKGGEGGEGKAFQLVSDFGCDEDIKA